MLNKDDTRIIITDVLKRLDMYSEVAVELLMGTCAVESNFGKYDKQLGGGPALGPWQMEPNTMNDIWFNYIRYRERLRIMLANEFGMSGPDKDRLQKDLEYAIVLARLKYRRSPLPLPIKPTDIAGLANYWKSVYNTNKGKGEVADFIRKYKTFCI